ncbi:MAG: hypothetical protein AAB506_00545 [Patescibacteria group bacterium]
MINRELQPFSERYRDIFSSEKSSSAKVLLKTVKTVWPQKGEIGGNLYKFARILDSAADESVFVIPVRKMIQKEIRSLNGQSEKTDLQRELVDESLINYPLVLQNRIKFHLSRMLRGILIDLDLRYTQRPPTRERVFLRNYLNLFESLQVLSLVVADNETRDNRQSRVIMDLWGQYDTLVDLSEDLPNGLCLIDRDTMEKYKIKLQIDQTVPKESLRRFQKNEGKRIANDLLQSQKDILFLGLPPWLAVMFFCYFLTKQSKLRWPPLVGSGLVYRPPLDAITRT